MKQSTKRFTTTALLLALIMLMGFIPNIGFIRIGPITMTLLAIPVIIGTLALGLQAGLILGLAFGIMSFLSIWLQGDVFGLMLWNISAVKTLLIIFIPRLLIPVVTYYVYRFLQSKYELLIEIILFAAFVLVGVLTFNSFAYYWVFFIPAGIILIIVVFFKKVDEVKLNYGVAALFGSLTNTVLFLGGLFVLFKPEAEIANVAEMFGTSVDGLVTVLASVAATNGIPEAVLACVLSVLILIPLAKSGLTIENKND